MARSVSITAAIILGGFTAAVFDILDAIIFYGLRGVPPIRIFHSIASGILGPAAFSGGLRTAALGLALHTFIAFTCAALFVLAAQLIPFLTHQPVRSGLLYGALIYIVMNYIVLPHIHVFGHPRPTPAILINGILAILLLVGLPISLITRRFAYPAN
jgi:hypothetical protein